MSKSSETVKVVVRCRPLSEREQSDGRQRIVEMQAQQGQVMLRNPASQDKEGPKTFTFDQVYAWDSHQATVFDITARPIVDACMDGYNGTIFAYGQTGTGKSFTMEGRDEPPEQRGIIPNAFNHIFETIARHGGSHEFLVRASYLEVYNEEIRDLLSKSPAARLDLKEHPERGVYVRDLMQFVVKSVAEISSVLQVGKKNRMVGATMMNQESSRSHSIFTVTIEATARFDAATAAAAAAAESDAAPPLGRIRVGKLNLVDLAGSERQSKTGATGDRLKEGIKINLSLTALGNVISALVDGRSGHVPYRDSKLTRLLQDSLGGNTKTVMVANIGPADWNYEETLSTLRYANRAKNITNKPRVNEDPKDAMLREFQDEIARLKAELQARQAAAAGDGDGAAAAARDGGGQVVERVVEVEPDKAALVAQLREQVRQELEQHQQQLQGQALEAARQEAEARAKQQLEALMAASDASNGQRLALREDLKRQIAGMRAMQEAAEADKHEQQELLQRIAAMESKVLHGGENMLDKVEALEARSEAAGAQLEIAAAQQREQQRRLEQLQLERLDLYAQYSSLEEEVAGKTRQLRALYGQYRERRAEAADLQASVQAEREELLADYRTLSQQLKLKNLAIAAFIPPPYQDLILAACRWSEYDERWVVDGIEAAGNNVRMQQDLLRQQAGAAASGPALDFRRLDEERLQRVYLSLDDLAQQQQQQPASYASARDASSSSWSKQQAAQHGASMAGVRPGSAAARRTKELLLLQAGLAGGGGGGGMLGHDAGSGSSQQPRGRPGTAGSSRGHGAAAAGGSVLGSVGLAGPEQAVVPRARGLVRGSTDALQLGPQPGSRGGL